MQQVDNSTFDNSWYNPGSKVKVILWYLINIFFFINPLNPSSGLKKILLKLFGAKIGIGVLIKPSVSIKYPWKLKIGNHSWIGEKVWIDNLDEIVIGKNVCISQGAMLLSGNHNYKKSNFDLIIGKITIEDGAWIGAQSTVCQNVICGTHSILAVGSVAAKNLEPYYIYKGNPAQKIRKRVINE